MPAALSSINTSKCLFTSANQNNACVINDLYYHLKLRKIIQTSPGVMRQVCRRGRGVQLPRWETGQSSLAFFTVTKCVTLPTWKESRLVWAQDFGGSSPCLIVLLAFGPVIRWYIMVGLLNAGSCLCPSCQKTNKGRKGSRVPMSPSRVPNDHITRSHFLQVLPTPSSVTG